MDPITIGLLAGTGLGLLKGEADKGKEKKQRLLNAEIVRYSPWTHMNPEAVQAADPTGAILQGGLTGAMMGQGVAATNKQNALLDAQSNYYNNAAASQSPWAFNPNAPYPYMPGQGPRMP